MVLKDEQLTVIHNGKNVFSMATYGQVEFSMGSYCLHRASRPLLKGRSGCVSPSTGFETMALHDAGVVYVFYRTFVCDISAYVSR